MRLTVSTLKERNRIFDDGERLGERRKVLVVVMKIKFRRQIQDQSVQKFFVFTGERIRLAWHGSILSRDFRLGARDRA